MNTINTFSSITEMQTIWAQNSERVLVDISDLDKNYQKRVKGTDMELAERYAEAMEKKAVFPPISVFECGGELVLVDGYTRVAAYEQLGVTEVEAVLYSGRTGDDAELFASFANANHGKRASEEDNSQAIAVLCKNDSEKTKFFKSKYALDANVLAAWVQLGPQTVRRLTVDYRNWLEAGRDTEVAIRADAGQRFREIKDEVGCSLGTVSGVVQKREVRESEQSDSIFGSFAGNTVFDAKLDEGEIPPDHLDLDFDPSSFMDEEEEEDLTLDEKLKKLSTHIAKGEALIQRHMAKPDRPKAPRKVQSERDKRIEEAERNGRLYVDAETFTANFSALVVNLNGYEASQNDPMLQSIISRIADDEFYTNDLAQLEAFFTALKQGLDAKRKAA